MAKQLKLNKNGPSPPKGQNTTGPSKAEVVEAPGVREQVLREATRLFAAKGFNGVSIREICEAVQITKPSLYYYFPSKADLFKTIVLGSVEDFRRRLEQVIAQPGPTRERLLRICRFYFAWAEQNAEPCRLLYSLYFSTERNVVEFDFDAYHLRNFGRIRDVVADGIASNELRQGDSWFMTMGLIGVINLLIMGMLYNPSTVPTGDLAELAVDFVLRGMAARETNESEAGQ